MYQRCAHGKVEFEELKWTSTGIEFARGNMGQKDNLFGMPAGSKDG